MSDFAQSFQQPPAQSMESLRGAPSARNGLLQKGISMQTLPVYESRPQSAAAGDHGQILNQRLQKSSN